MPFPGVHKVYELVQVRLLGATLRRLGQAMVRTGDRIGADTISRRNLQPNPANLNVNNQKPNIAETSFVGKNTVVSGHVDIGSQAFILYNNVLKAVGPYSRIELEPNVYLMDHVTIRADDGKSVKVGHKSIINSHATLHNCTIGKGAFVGPRAMVGPGAFINDYGGLAAGSVLEAGQVVPTRQFWAGTPAKYLREITEEEVEYFKDFQENNDKLRDIYDTETSMPGPIYSEIDHEFLGMGDTTDNAGYDGDFLLDRIEPVFQQLNYSIKEGESQHRTIRSLRINSYQNAEEQERDILYDGNQEKGPAYLNEFKRTHRTENELKKSLEYDPERIRMRKEEFEAPRQQLDDSQFKRKF